MHQVHCTPTKQLLPIIQSQMEKNHRSKCSETKNELLTAAHAPALSVTAITNKLTALLNFTRNKSIYALLDRQHTQDPTSSTPVRMVASDTCMDGAKLLTTRQQFVCSSLPLCNSPLI